MTERDAHNRRKLYSQNFLRGGPIVARMVAEAGIHADDLVVEIGGGSGILTRILERTGCRLIVVERDPHYSSVLAKRYDNHRQVTIIAGDVRVLRWPTESFRIFANIPFGLTTEILRAALEESGLCLQRADLLVQLDVARKRVRPPQGNKLNLVWAPWWTMRMGRRLPRELFTPQPSIDVAMLNLQRRAVPLLAWNERSLWRNVLEYAFERAGQPVRRAFRGVLTSTQLHRFAVQRGIQLKTPVVRLTLDDWRALHAIVRDYAPRERWPHAFTQALKTQSAPRPNGLWAGPDDNHV
jgi:23S rRNA (adenine-N6)-dimethyltransferase